MDIVCHMITSLDGCILLERWSKPAERVDFTQVYEATAKRLQGDGWMVGRITMAEYGQGVVEGEPAGMRGRGESVPRAYVGDRQDRPLAVVFDPKGRLQFSKNGLPTGEHVVAVLDPKIDEAHLHGCAVRVFRTFSKATVRNALNAKNFRQRLLRSKKPLA